MLLWLLRIQPSFFFFLGRPLGGFNPGLPDCNFQKIFFRKKNQQSHTLCMDEGVATKYVKGSTVKVPLANTNIGALKRVMDEDDSEPSDAETLSDVTDEDDFPEENEWEELFKRLDSLESKLDSILRQLGVNATTTRQWTLEPSPSLTLSSPSTTSLPSMSEQMQPFSSLNISESKKLSLPSRRISRHVPEEIGQKIFRDCTGQSRSRQASIVSNNLNTSVSTPVSTTNTSTTTSVEVQPSASMPQTPMTN